MSDPDQKNWHQKTSVRLVLLLLLPLIVGGLYLLTTRLAVRRPRSVPVSPETSVPQESDLSHLYPERFYKII